MTPSKQLSDLRKSPNWHYAYTERLGLLEAAIPPSYAHQKIAQDEADAYALCCAAVERTPAGHVRHPER